MKSFGWLIALAGLVACSTTEPKADARVSVAVDRQATLVSYPSTGGVVATIPLTIRNAGTTSVWYDLCGNSLQRSTDAGWQDVWVQICSLSATLQPGGNPFGTEIGPGEELTTTVQVSTWLGQGWSQPLSGDYRFRAGLFTERSQVPAATRTTAPFEFQIQVP